MRRRVSGLNFKLVEMLQQQLKQTQIRLEKASEAKQFLEDIAEEYQQHIEFIQQHLEAVTSGKAPDFSLEVEVSQVDNSVDKPFANKSIAEAVREVLSEKQQPMHVREIITALEMGGWTTDARRPDSSIVSVLIRDERFKRVGSNTFTLSQPPLLVNDGVLAGVGAD